MSLAASLPAGVGGTPGDAPRLGQRCPGTPGPGRGPCPALGAAAAWKRHPKFPVNPFGALLRPRGGLGGLRRPPRTRGRSLVLVGVPPLLPPRPPGSHPSSSPPPSSPREMGTFVASKCWFFKRNLHGGPSGWARWALGWLWQVQLPLSRRLRGLPGPPPVRSWVFGQTLRAVPVLPGLSRRLSPSSAPLCFSK